MNNNDNLFGTNPVSNENNDFFQNNMTSTNETESTSLFDDPTTVDINKIREQSSDINFNINNNLNSESSVDMESLLGKNNDSPSRFIPN